MGIVIEDKNMDPGEAINFLKVKRESIRDITIKLINNRKLPEAVQSSQKCFSFSKKIWKICFANNRDNDEVYEFAYDLLIMEVLLIKNGESAEASKTLHDCWVSLSNSLPPLKFSEMTWMQIDYVKVLKTSHMQLVEQFEEIIIDSGIIDNYSRYFSDRFSMISLGSTVDLIMSIRSPMRGLIASSKGKRHWELLAYIAGLFLHFKNFNGVESTFTKTIEIVQMTFGEKSIELSTVFFMAGVFYYRASSVKKALVCFKRSLKIRLEVMVPNNSLSIADCYFNLGLSYLKFDRITKAKENLWRALKIKYENNGIGSPSLLGVLEALGKLHMQEESFEDCNSFPH